MISERLNYDNELHAITMLVHRCGAAFELGARHYSSSHELTLGGTHGKFEWVRWQQLIQTY